MTDSSDGDDRTVIKVTQHGIDGNSLAIGTRLGEFEITSVIGEGGFGIVYLAWDHSLQRRVALKEYMPSALAARGGATLVRMKSERHRETFEAGLKSFINEARLLAQFDHPSLVKVYRFWEENGTAYMIMPFYEGTTLKDALRASAMPLDETSLCNLLAPLADALSLIHAEQCYHRDIAPDNIILLAASGRPLLLDFGAARRVIGDLTQALTVILKPGYAPVEQYAEVASMKQGAWTDVYALAAVMYFAITGTTPPPAVGRLVSDTYVPLSERAAGRYSDRFLRAIDRALVVTPDERTQSIAQFSAELGLPREFHHDSGGHSGNSGTAIPKPSPTQSRPSIVTPRDSLPWPRSNESVASAPVSGSAGVPTPSTWYRRPIALAGLGIAALATAGFVAYMLLMSPPPTREQASGSAGGTTTVPPPDPALADASGTSGNQTNSRAAPPLLVEPLKISQEFRRVVAAAAPGISVEAHPSSKIYKIDRDHVTFSITSSRDGHVYVLVHDTDGSLMLLFPKDPLKGNQIRRGQTLVLPPPDWGGLTVGGPPGVTHVLVIVSALPRDFSAAGTTKDENGFVVFPSEQAAAILAASYRGPVSIFAGKPKCDGGNDCGDEFGAATFEFKAIP